MTTSETAAARDVLAERQRQIAKGYTPEHDDEHPLSHVLRYGGITWNLATRAELVRMAACLLAGIEWLDRREEAE